MSERSSNAAAEQHLKRWQATGEMDALDLLLRSEIDFLKQRLRTRAGDALDGSFAASDLAQEAVLGLLRVKTMPTFDNPAAFHGYLWTAAWRLLQARLGVRARTPRPRPLDEHGSSLEADLALPGGRDGSSIDSDVSLHLALNLLHPEERDLLILVYFDSLDLTEAAGRLCITRDAANMRLVRARRHLAEKLKAWRSMLDHAT